MRKFLAFAFLIFLLNFLFACEKSGTDGNQGVLGQTQTGRPIRELTEAAVVSSFVKKNHHLPDFYITKREAQSRGWIPSEENLCQVLPGKAIGGDVFRNREGLLPKGYTYYEADLNYNCRHRGTDRLIFDEQGNVWITKNHYKTFEKL